MPAQAVTKPLDGPPRIERHKTALSRTDFSRPVARALFDGLITDETTVFDYGCGRGGDVERLSEMGVDVAGFDPKFAPDAELRPSRIVNLGFVVNVIEDPRERAEVLLKAWDLTEGTLIVSARLIDESRGLKAEELGDGVVTELGTFQKFYEQGELRGWIGEILNVQPVAAEPGIFYVFRHTAEAQLFLLTRVRRVPPAPKRSEAVFEEHHNLLNKLMQFFEDNGRLPRAGEFEEEAELRASVGTPREAWRIILNVTDEEKWDRVRLAKYEDLLVYLALQRFQSRPKLSHLPETLQNDIRDFFGTYKGACEQADRLLFSLSDQERLREAMRASSVGKKVGESLCVHSSLIPTLPTSLRVLEGCARQLLGDISSGAVVKFDGQAPRLVYLEYPEFHRDPYPALKGAYIVELKSLVIRHVDYSQEPNPPILYGKESFLGPFP